jgi:hypothetical protein
MGNLGKWTQSVRPGIPIKRGREGKDHEGPQSRKVVTLAWATEEAGPETNIR